MKRRRPLNVKRVQFDYSRGVPDVIEEDAGYDYLTMAAPKPMKSPSRGCGDLMVGDEDALEIQEYRYFPAARAVSPRKIQYQLESSILMRHAVEDQMHKLSVAELPFGGLPDDGEVNTKQIDNNQEEQYLGNIEGLLNWE